MIKTFTHKIIASILVIMLFAHNINTLIIVGAFIVNQDLIAKTLCVQKEAQKGCNGKCQLKKQLTKNNTTTNGNQPFQENEKTTLDIYCLFSSRIPNILSNTFTLPQINLSYRSIKIVKTTIEVETPPPLFI